MHLGFRGKGTPKELNNRDNVKIQKKVQVIDYVSVISLAPSTGRERNSPKGTF